MKEYDEVKLNGNVPQWLKMLMIFIDRVGFPTLAFILMFYVSFTSLAKVSSSITENTNVLTKLVASSEQFQKIVQEEHKCMRENQIKIMDRVNVLR